VSVFRLQALRNTILKAFEDVYYLFVICSALFPDFPGHTRNVIDTRRHKLFVGPATAVERACARLRRVPSFPRRHRSLDALVSAWYVSLGAIADHKAYSLSSLPPPPPTCLLHAFALHSRPSRIARRDVIQYRLLPSAG
jgi:hypothetical protein